MSVTTASSAGIKPSAAANPTPTPSGAQGANPARAKWVKSTGSPGAPAGIPRLEAPTGAKTAGPTGPPATRGAAASLGRAAGPQGPAPPTTGAPRADAAPSDVAVSAKNTSNGLTENEVVAHPLCAAGRGKALAVVYKDIAKVHSGRGFVCPQHLIDVGAGSGGVYVALREAGARRDAMFPVHCMSSLIDGADVFRAAIIPKTVATRGQMTWETHNPKVTGCHHSMANCTCGPARLASALPTDPSGRNYLFVHSFYYLNPDTDFGAVRCGDVFWVIAHRFDGQGGELNRGEFRWERDGAKIKMAPCGPVGKAYEHPDVSARLDGFDIKTAVGKLRVFGECVEYFSEQQTYLYKYVVGPTKYSFAPQFKVAAQPQPTPPPSPARQPAPPPEDPMDEVRQELKRALSSLPLTPADPDEAVEALSKRASIISAKVTSISRTLKVDRDAVVAELKDVLDELADEQSTVIATARDFPELLNHGVEDGDEDEYKSRRLAVRALAWVLITLTMVLLAGMWSHVHAVTDEVLLTYFFMNVVMACMALGPCLSRPQARWGKRGAALRLRRGQSVAWTSKQEVKYTVALTAVYFLSVWSVAYSTVALVCALAYWLYWRRCHAKRSRF